MITGITIEYFKALRNVHVDLSPFTVLIGPNDSGKSSILEAVYALAESTRNQLQECFWSPWENRELVYLQRPDTDVVLNAELPPVANSITGAALAAGNYLIKLAFTPRACSLRDERVVVPGVLDELTQLGGAIGSNQTMVQAWRHNQGKSNTEQAARYVSKCLRDH